MRRRNDGAHTADAEHGIDTILAIQHVTLTNRDLDLRGRRFSHPSSILSRTSGDQEIILCACAPPRTFSPCSPSRRWVDEVGSHTPNDLRKGLFVDRSLESALGRNATGCHEPLERGVERLHALPLA